MTSFTQHRPTTLAARGLVAAPHYLAAEAGLDMLKAGGNAVDAAIAANAVLQVVYPNLCGLGGDLFLVLYDARSERVYGLNSSGRSAKTATIERYRELGLTEMPPFGIYTVTVPGCAAGWGAASERFGRLGLARSLAAAISYAEDGFPVGPQLHAGLVRMDTMPHTHASFREHFMPGGVIPPAGSLARAPALARTLRILALRGAQDFYRGELAEHIAAFLQREGGLLTLDDLAAHTADWVEPLSVPFAGVDVYELPPNTQGVTALQMLGMTDGLPLGDSPVSPETIHVEVEAKKVAWADRAAYLTDPAAMRVAPEALIAADYLAERRRLIDTRHAGATIAPGTFTGDTIYLCAADADGTVVSLIQSNYRGFGSGLVVEGTGISLHNRGAYFSLDPTAANALGPAKRTLHTIIPSLAMRDGRPAMVFGAMGGDGQPQTHVQVYTDVLRYGLNIQAAIEVPRWIHGVETPGEPETLRIEDRVPAATVERLRALGHRVETVGPWDSIMGHANGIVVDQASGVYAGGSDPRSEGAAAGW